VDRHQLAEHLRFYQDLGVTGLSTDAAWRRRPESASAQLASPREPAAEAVPIAFGRPSIETLSAIREDIGDCTRCKLHALGRQQIVYGVGNPNADLMFVGEAPGADEDVQGVPFVGRAGQLLTRIIEAIGLKRDDVYIANVIKCRPPGNRNPEPDEVEACERFLFRQIDSIKPKVIVALGTFAAKALLKTQDPISRLRGRVYDYRGAKLIPTFHPAFLLRTTERKRDVWEDMKKVRSILRDPDE
jgi:uracil-DNA glycosylase family 4